MFPYLAHQIMLQISLFLLAFITTNCFFIQQRIKEGSLIDQIKVICVGDHVESINGKSVVGCRHYEVAKHLKDLEKGQTIMLKLVEPMKSFGE